MRTKLLGDKLQFLILRNKPWPILCVFSISKKKKKSEYAIDRCFHHAVLIVINHLYKFSTQLYR